MSTHEQSQNRLDRVSEYHVIMGLPGAGKSTYAEHQIVPDKTPVILTLEAYAEDAEDRPRMTTKSWVDFYADLSEVLSGDDIVVIDGNNLHSGSRRQALLVAKEMGAQHTRLHVLCTTPRMCVQRARRAGVEMDGRILRKNIDKFFLSLALIADEPWDEVTFIPASSNAATDDAE